MAIARGTMTDEQRKSIALEYAIFLSQGVTPMVRASIRVTFDT
jgi:hypothetical protein